ncbi:glycoside hydrolase family 3 protein [Flammeovirga sp. SJP92]|uniref:glycoside hydrolase family 3 protein n=1 Tax=Flammeovirga sp. SJP92 TaxID=1775430 RepID=UPI00156084F1|nr:glycoside hydrolase family 3 N-terminal domain-containing protein [Flammeovirga sp. SJP92]
MKSIFFLKVFIVISTITLAQEKRYPAFFNASMDDLHWVDSVWSSLSEDEKIAQLFIVPHYTSNSYSEVEDLVEKYNVGGVIFFKGRAETQINAINKLNKVAKTPLVYTLDAEWGLGMRLPKDGISYPYAMTLGAIENDSLIYEMGVQMAEQLKRVGVSVSYGPVVDLNNNPLNPVINYRSFGENKEKVASKAIQYMHGLQSQNVLAVGKHFPGHGDTSVDSHKDLPVIPHDVARLDSMELYPYKKLIEAGVGGVMTAHLSVPVWDEQPSSLSPKIITEILRDSLAFNGLVFTDGILMNAITKRFKNYGKADAKALVAGNDVVEFTNHIGDAIDAVKDEIEAGNITWESIDDKGWRVLLMKKWAGLHQPQSISTKNLHADLHPKKAGKLIQNIADEAVTLLQYEGGLPLEKGNGKVAIVNVGSKNYTEVEKALKEQGLEVESFFLSKRASTTEVNALIKKLKKFDTVISQLSGFYMTQGAKDIAVELEKGKASPAMRYPYKITYTQIKYIEQARSLPQHFTVVLGNAYVLRSFQGIEKQNSVILTYQNSKALRKAVGKLIVGKIQPKGTLPVTIDKRYKEGISFKSFENPNI